MFVLVGVAVVGGPPTAAHSTTLSLSLELELGLRLGLGFGFGFGFGRLLGPTLSTVAGFDGRPLDWRLQ